MTLPTENPEIVKRKIKDIPVLVKYFQLRELHGKSQVTFIDTPGKFKYRRLWRELIREHQPNSIFFFINDDKDNWHEQVSALEDLYNYWHDALGLYENDATTTENATYPSEATLLHSHPTLLKIICNPFNLKKNEAEGRKKLLSDIRERFGHVLNAFNEIPEFELDIVILSVPFDPIADVIIQIMDVFQFLLRRSHKKK